MHQSVQIGFRANCARESSLTDSNGEEEIGIVGGQYFAEWCYAHSSFVTVMSRLGDGVVGQDGCKPEKRAPKKRGFAASEGGGIASPKAWLLRVPGMPRWLGIVRSNLLKPGQHVNSREVIVLEELW